MRAPRQWLGGAQWTGKHLPSCVQLLLAVQTSPLDRAGHRSSRGMGWGLSTCSAELWFPGDLISALLCTEGGREGVFSLHGCFASCFL